MKNRIYQAVISTIEIDQSGFFYRDDASVANSAWSEIFFWIVQPFSFFSKLKCEFFLIV